MKKLLNGLRTVGVVWAGAGLLSAACLTASPALASVRIIAAAKAGDGQALLGVTVKAPLALNPGDSLIVYDALDQNEIVDVTLPDKPGFTRLDRKTTVIAPAIGRVREWVAGMHAPASDDLNLIHASALLDVIAPVIAEHGGSARVMLIGAPWFSAQGAFSAKSYIGAFPSDGMILGSHSESPFGTEGRRDLTGGVSVDYCVMGGAAVFSSPAQLESFHRAWALLLRQRGANLSTFTTDLAACMDSFARPTAVEGEPFYFDEADARVVRMHRVEEATPTVETLHPASSPPPAVPHPTAWATPAPAAEQRTIFDTPVRPTPPATLSGPAWIGIQWNEVVDLDLYARCSPTSPFLYYGNRSSLEGRHDFDFRGGTAQDFEVVELLAPCPDISKAAVFINFFGGSVRTPIKGVVAIKFDGGFYKSDFTMPALTGNGGQGLTPTATMSGPAWVRIDVPSLLRLQGHSTTRIN